jgi:hypothetical protein
MNCTARAAQQQSEPRPFVAAEQEWRCRQCVGPWLLDGATITYERTDVADLNPGEDLWRYAFTVEGHNFEENQGFSIYFDAALFANLEDPPAQVPGWDILSLQPDPLLPSAGVYDALALMNGASLAAPFNVTLTWLGGSAAPGSLLFDIVRYNPTGNAILIESGQATNSSSPAPVPEPSTLLLVASGITVALRRHRVRRRRESSSRPA